MVDAVKRLPFVVSSVEKKQRRKRPAAPFTTSTLQQEAAKKLGFSSRRTRPSPGKDSRLGLRLSKS